MTKKQKITTVPYPRLDKPEAYLNSLPLRVRAEKAANLAVKYEDHQRRAAHIRNVAAAKLNEQGFTYAEIGTILNVSPSRVKQYIQTAKTYQTRTSNPNEDWEENEEHLEHTKG